MSFWDCLHIKNLVTKPSAHCRNLYKILFWLTLIVIFYLAFAPNVSVGPEFENADKYKHTLAFFVLTNLFMYAYEKGFKLVWFWMLLIGIFIEVVQHFIPNRESSVFDILADGTGIFLATIFKIWIEKNYEKDKR